MSDKRARAGKEFRTMMKWIVLAAILMVVGGLYYSSLVTELTTHLVIAVILGTFFRWCLALASSLSHSSATRAGMMTM